MVNITRGKRCFHITVPQWVTDYESLYLKRVVKEDGTIFYYNIENQLHRDFDLPAVIVAGAKKLEWWANGQLHRDNDSPAIITHAGYQVWYQHGVVHRDNDSPAAIYENGDMCWYQYGVLHRDGGEPALIMGENHEWYSLGELKQRSPQHKRAAATLSP